MSDTIHTQSMGVILQLSGIAAFAIGAVLSFHHTAIAIAFIGGAVVYFVGKKFRAQ
jgi:hypothetical protein